MLTAKIVCLRTPQIKYTLLFSTLIMGIPLYSMGCFTCCMRPKQNSIELTAKKQPPKKPERKLITKIELLRDLNDTDDTCNRLAKSKKEKAFLINYKIICRTVYALPDMQPFNRDLIAIIAIYAAEYPMIEWINTESEDDYYEEESDSD